MLIVFVQSFAKNVPKDINLQEAHGPHSSPEKPVQINKHIWAKLSL